MNKNIFVIETKEGLCAQELLGCLEDTLEDKEIAVGEIMSAEHRKDLYEKAWQTWGSDLQYGMFYEEVGELMQAINKFRRHNTQDNHDCDAAGCKWSMIEEIADVHIMLEQLTVMHGIVDDVSQAKDQKLSRLKRKLGYQEK